MNLFTITPLRKKTFFLILFFYILVFPIIFIAFSGVFSSSIPSAFDCSGGFFMAWCDPNVFGWIILAFILFIFALLISWLLTFTALKLDTKQKRYFVGFFIFIAVFFLYFPTLFLDGYILPFFSSLFPALFYCGQLDCEPIGTAGKILTWLISISIISFIAFILSFPIRFTEKKSETQDSLTRFPEQKIQ